MKADALRTLQDIFTEDAVRLTQVLAVDATTARIEVQSLLQKVTQRPRAWLLAHAAESLPAAQQAEYVILLQRRLQGEPVAYILGEREFFGLMFQVTPVTLIPRPETELLVELTLQRIPVVQPMRVLDLGTGSGAVALAIAHARPAAQVLACDASAAALAVAQRNAQRLGISNAAFLHSDWFAALDAQHFDLIVSNPPYVAAGDAHLQQGDLRFEPVCALVSGADGLHDIHHIVSHAHAHLEPGGWLLLEHGYNQAEPVREWLRAEGYRAVFTARDLAGVERVSGARA